MTPATTKTVLRALLKASNALTLPDLQTAVQSIVEVIKPIENANQNNCSGLQELSFTLCRLWNAAIMPLSTTYNAAGLSLELEARIESLARELSEIAKSCRWLKRYRKNQAFSISDNKVSSAVMSLNRGISESIDKFSRYSQIANALVNESGGHHVPHTVAHMLGKEVEMLPRSSAAIHASTHKQGVPLCLSGTREAVLNTVDIWLNNSGHRLLVLKGSAGTGKSTIARTIATVLTDQHRLAATFFFSKDDYRRSSPSLLFPTIAFQLAQHTKDFATHISNALEQSPYVTSQSLHEKFEKLITKPLGGTNQTIAPLPLLVILDGLDQCEIEGAIHILRLLTKFPSYMKILITTRPSTHFQPIFDSLRAKEQVHLDQIGNFILEGEIRRFLQRQLSQPKIQEALPGCKLQLKNEDLDILANGAGRAFLVPAVIEKVVKDAKIRDPQSQLEVVLEVMKKANKRKPSASTALDHGYTLVLELTFPATTTPSVNGPPNMAVYIGHHRRGSLV